MYMGHMHVYQCLMHYTINACHRLKQPEYQCYREKLGAAKSLETVEQICHELKSLLQVHVRVEAYTFQIRYTCSFQIRYIR